MRIVPRIILLVLFASLGVGLAAYVVRMDPESATMAARRVSPSLDRSETAALAPRPVSAHSFAPPSLSRDSNMRQPQEAVAPDGRSSRREPTIATAADAPFPPVLAQVQSPAPESSIPATVFLKALEAIGGQTRAAETQPSSPIAPPSEAVEVVPKAAPSTTTEARSNRIQGEGDGRLSLRIQDTDIREVLDLLSEQGDLNILASKSVQGNVSATLKNTSVDEALEAVLRSTGFIARREGNFIYVGTAQDFDDISQALDTVGTRVYRPNYVTAKELQSIVTPLLTQGVGVIGVTSPAESGIASDTGNAGGDAFAQAEALLVKDYEAVLHEMDAIVAELDRQPLQVHIEAMILSVKLDDRHELGVDWQFLRDQGNVRFGINAPLPSLAAAPLDGGLQFAFLDSNLSTFIRALETIGDTNVIATPRLMVLNKQRAEILIGAELGYVNTTITETSASQTVEFLEVGAQLRIRPFIASDGAIRMEVHPELSTGTVRTEGGFTLPDKEVTQVTTNIMVRDGCTVIIGGLMREDLSTSTSQVPLLGSLPLIGPVFRSQQETIERREILVLVTPRIVQDQEACWEGAEGQCEYNRRQDAYRHQMHFTGKRHLAAEQIERAKTALAAGDQSGAIRRLNLAVHFDPLNREALELRSQLLDGGLRVDLSDPFGVEAQLAYPKESAMRTP